LENLKLPNERRMIISPETPMMTFVINLISLFNIAGKNSTDGKTMQVNFSISLINGVDCKHLESLQKI